MKSLINKILLPVLVIFSITACKPEEGFPDWTNDEIRVWDLADLDPNPPGKEILLTRARYHSEVMCYYGDVSIASNNETQYETTGCSYAEHTRGRTCAIPFGADYQVVGDASRSLFSTMYGTFSGITGENSCNGETDYPFNYEYASFENFTHQIVGQHLCGDGRYYVTHVFLKCLAP